MTFGPHTRLTSVTNACASPHSGLIQAACESCHLQSLMTEPAFILSPIAAWGGHCWSVLTGRPLQAQLDASCVHGVNVSRLSTLLSLSGSLQGGPAICNAMHPGGDPVCLI